MSGKVTLTVTEGRLKGTTFVYVDRTTCILGRSDECEPRLPDDEHHRTVSRHHCLLDINPPDVRIRDFGSLNGTFLNGQKIGQREHGLSAEEAAGGSFPEHDLSEGDVVQLGETKFLVQIETPTECTVCGCEIEVSVRPRAEIIPGIFQCDACRKKAEAARRPPPKPAPKRCVQCGRNVEKEAEQHRQGDYVCHACKKDPQQILQHLLQLANAGRKDLIPIKGYHVERELGRGGMGAVYLARKSGSSQPVALKIMLPEVAANQQATATFMREVENTKALHHPNVVQLLDAGCSDGTFFFTLELCDSGSLADLAKQRGGKLPLKEAAALILQTLEGLEYAHHAPIPNVPIRGGKFQKGKGLVHRDLKPANIFLTSSPSGPVAKVADFGLAKAFDSAGLSGHTRTGSVAGTPVFMPRQQVINFKYSKPEIDVWAAAASFYFLLTGQFPRDFRNDRDVWKTVLEQDTVPIRQRDSSIPRKLADVIDKALREKPTIGFPSAKAFQKELTRVL